MELNLTDEIDNGDGTVSLHFDVDEEAAVLVADIGMKLLLHCKLLGITPDELFEELKNRVMGEE